MTSFCGRCKAEVYWLRLKEHPETKPIIIDALPRPNGMFRICLETGEWRPKTIEEQTMHRDTGRPALYDSHFAYCPYADEYRKEKVYEGKKRKLAKAGEINRPLAMNKESPE